MAERKILTTGNAFKRTDGRWNGVVWYMDKHGERKRKSFSATTKTEVTKRMRDYISEFNTQVEDSDEAKKTLETSMTNWLQVFKFPSVERGTYDRLECTARNQIYPLIGEKIIGDITAADLKSVLNHWMDKRYAYTTVKKVHDLLGEYFRYLTEQEILPKNPMNSVPMMKKANYMAAQGEEDVPINEQVTIFTPEEIEKFKTECFRTWGTGKRMYQQSAAYIFMLNTGLRTGEMLGILNSDVDLENRVVHVRQGVKEISRREGTEATSGREVAVGKPKSASSKRDVPLNDTAIAMVEELRRESYFGPNSPLVADEKGSYTRPVNFRKRFYRILAAVGIEQKGLHSLRHRLAGDGPLLSLRDISPAPRGNLIRHQPCEWHPTGRRHDPCAFTPAGSGSAWPQYQPDHGDVLRQEGHQQAGGGDGWV